MIKQFDDQVIPTGFARLEEQILGGGWRAGELMVLQGSARPAEYKSRLWLEAARLAGGTVRVTLEDSHTQRYEEYIQRMRQRQETFSLALSHTAVTVAIEQAFPTQPEQEQS